MNVFSNTNIDNLSITDLNDDIDFTDVIKLKARAKTEALTIIAWNCGGLTRTKAEELNVTLRDFGVDIVLISETWFTKNDFKRYFEGYKMYNSFHPSNKKRGGSSILIKNNIEHNLIKIIQTDIFQSVVIKLPSAIGDFNLASIYAPPNNIITTANFLELFRELGQSFLIGGDFNSKNPIWGSRLTNPKGKNLFEAVKKINGNFISPGKPTNFPYNQSHKPDIIDFFIFKNLNLINKTVCDTLHSPIVGHAKINLTIHMNPILINKPPAICSRKTNWTKFREDLEKLIFNNIKIDTPAKIDEETEKLVEQIQHCAKINTPIAINEIRPYKIPKNLLNLIRSKRKIQRKYSYTQDPEDKAHFNRLNKLVRKHTQSFLNNKFERFLLSLSDKKDKDYTLWAATKYLKRPKQLNFPIKKKDGTWAETDKDKAEILADHFENTFKPHNFAEIEGEHESENVGDESPPKSKKVKKIPPSKIKTITPSEIKREIQGKIKIKKAPGFDKISGLLLKNLPNKAIMKLVCIFNAVIKIKYIPQQWKIAEIFVLLKPDKSPAETSSYRPISLLPVISKLFEKLYIKRLNEIVGKKHLIIDAQFGFRAKHSTIEQLHRVTSYIENALEKGKFCVAVFLDVAQAFDRVWHERLVEKLFKILPCNHVELLSSFLEGRQFRIRYENAISSLRPIGAGVPQGSCLSPLLYSLFTSDIPQPRGEGKMGIYADDTLVMDSSKSYREARQNVQLHLNKIDRWTTNDKIKLNATKSIEVVFTNRKFIHKPLHLGENIIPREKVSKYLGLHLDSKLRWKEHIKKKVAQVKLKFLNMFWLLGKKSKLDLRLKLLLYKSMLRPIWSYGCQLWGCAAVTNLNQIEIIQMKILRNIAKARWYERNVDIRADLNIDSVEDYITKLYTSYENRLHNHPNPEALALLEKSENVRRLKRRKTFELGIQGFSKLFP